MCNLTSV